MAVKGCSSWLVLTSCRAISAPVPCMYKKQLCEQVSYKHFSQRLSRARRRLHNITWLTGTRPHIQPSTFETNTETGFPMFSYYLCHSIASTSIFIPIRTRIVSNETVRCIILWVSCCLVGFVGLVGRLYSSFIQWYVTRLSRYWSLNQVVRSA